MQSEPLQRDVFTKPPREAKLPSDMLLKIELPHYGLVESSSCFFEAYYPVFTEKLHMKSAAFDPCFLYQVNTTSLTGIAGLATDDSINTGNLEYQKDEKQATKAFVTRRTDDIPLRFLGFLIERDDCSLSLWQDQHIRKLKSMDPHMVRPDLFSTIRGQLLFISQSSRPDIAYAVAQLCQIKKSELTKAHVKALNDVVTHLKNTPELKLQYRTLHHASMKIYVFVDSGHNTNKDKTSQLGFLVCLVDKDNNCHILHWASAKCARVTRSMLAGETYAFSLGYDYGVSLRMLLRNMKVDIPLFLFTDSKSIFDTVTASKRLRELRLMNEISDVRRAYKDGEITNVAWVRSAQNIADNFTCMKGNDILHNTMSTGKLNFVIEQWVYNEKSPTSPLSSQSK